MIRGIGTDIIEIRRIEQSIERYGQRFLDRIFTSNEQDYCLRFRDSGRHFAGRFAAKEAIAKALGTGLSQGLTWLDIDICNDLKGRPEVRLSPTAQLMFPSHHLHLSISHSKDYATALAINEQR